MEEKQFRVGIIGMGKMGKIRAEQVENHPNLKLAAISDIDKTASEGFSVPFFKDPLELIEQDVDIIFIATFNNVAAEYAMKSLQSGKHVFCEKPPGVSSKEVEEVIKVEESLPGLKLKYGFNHRYHYSIIEAKKIIDSGMLGKILWLRGVYGKAGGNYFRSNWRSNASHSGGGILIDQGIHMLDLLRFFCGDFNSVQSCVSKSYWDIPVEDNAFAILKNDDNQIALFHSSATQWKHKFSLEICLEDGYLNLNGILSSTRSYGDEMLTYAKKQFEDTATAFGKPREQTIYFDTDDSWELEVKEFVDAIINDSEIEFGNSKDALSLMKLLELIYENAG